MPKGNEVRYSANALARGLEIITLFNDERPSLSLAEIAKLLGVSRTVPYRLLYTLESLGYLRQNEKSKRYELTPRVLELGFSYLNSMELTDIAQPYLEQLRDEFNVSCHLSMLDGTDVVYIGTATIRGVTALNVNVGLRLKAHAVANGWILLAHQPEEYLENYYNDSNIRSLIDQKFKNLTSFKQRLKKIKEQGFAVSIGEFLPSINSIAVPILGLKGEVVAALNVVGTEESLHSSNIEGEVLTRLKEVSDKFLKYQPIKT